MVGRPRTVTNDDILAATARVLARVGPARLTLADVAGEVGLAPATLLQRFGSKRGLLLASAEHSAADAGRQLREARQAGGSPLDALLDGLCAITESVATPQALSNSLASLHLDLDDPELHRHALQYVRTLRSEIQTLLDSAVELGELPPVDTARLARTIQATFNGALMTWALYREGTLADWLRNDLAVLLQPLRKQARNQSDASAVGPS